MNKILALIMALSISSAVYAHDVGTYVPNMTANTDEQVNVRSQHHARLINNTNNKQKYHVRLTLCAQSKGCSQEYNVDVFIPAHSERTVRQTMEYSFFYTRSGKYAMTGTTEVTGDGGQVKGYTGYVTVR